MPEPPSPPPRTARIRRWTLDATLVVSLTLAALAGGGQHREPWGAVAIVFATAPLLARRRRPLSSFAVQLAATGLAGPVRQAPVVMLLALAIGGYAAIGVSGTRPRLLAAAGAAGAVTILRYTSAGGHDLPGLCALWLLALALRSLWQRSLTAQRYAKALERESAARQALAVQGERARIARELHDVLGHNLSVMMIHAGAARQAVGGQADAARSLLQVEAAGREAMSELRSLLELLGTEPDDSAPQPGLGDLETLLERTRAAGLPARLVSRGPARPLEPGLELAAYRVVQEGLTNALKHAPGAPTDVTVLYEPAALHVTVRDQGTNTTEPDPAGRGLLGLRERVALYHGVLHVGPASDGGYELRASFPLNGFSDTEARAE